MTCAWCRNGITGEGRRTHKHLCVKHRRFKVIRATSRRRGKMVPTYEQLELLLQALDDMKCPACRRGMNWEQKDGADTVLTIQHYRDGRLGFLCLSCNTRERL